MQNMLNVLNYVKAEGLVLTHIINTSVTTGNVPYLNKQ